MHTDVQFSIALKRCPIDNYAHNRSHNYPSFIKTVDLLVTKLIPPLPKTPHTQYMIMYLLHTYVHTYMRVYMRHACDHLRYITCLCILIEVFSLLRTIIQTLFPGSEENSLYLWH